jgi:hypothetical protein
LKRTLCSSSCSTLCRAWHSAVAVCYSAVWY